MNIGIINLEPKVVNTALMQIAEYYKRDHVEWFDYKKDPIYSEMYDKIYCSSIFDFTYKQSLPPKTICGGSGFDLDTNLPEGIASCGYDYSIYPECDYSILWFSRGCIRNCPFCLVRQKEGGVSPVDPKNLNPRGTHIKIQDNNFFANPEWREAIDYLIKLNQPVNFASGIDIRLINKEQCNAINSLRRHGQIHIAWDNPKDDLIPNIKTMLKHIKPYRVMCYVLIGYWSTPEEDEYRVETLRELKIDPFVMVYDKTDRYQKDYARYVNCKQIFKSVKWKDYRSTKAGVSCG